MQKIRNQSKNSIIFIVISLSSLIGFIILYILLNTTSVQSYYTQGLILAIPTLLLFTISILNVKKIIPFNVSLYLALLTIAVSITLLIIMIIYFVFNSATTKTTDMERYEQALNAIDYPNNIATTFLPEQIPIDAQNIEFSYQPAFAQGGETLSLMFDAPSNVIADYFDFFNANTSWSGDFNETVAQDNGIYPSSFIAFTDYSGRLPSDLHVFLIYSKGYRDDDFNHGEVSFVALSKTANKILFSYENW